MMEIDNQIIQCSVDEPRSKHFICTSKSNFTDTDVKSKVDGSGKWEGLHVSNNESNIHYVQNGYADSNTLHPHETVIYSHSEPQQTNVEKKQQFMFKQHAQRQHGIRDENRSTRRAKFRSYSKYSIREKSFIGWISDSGLPIWMFAKAGFFYKGFADIVACFECGIIHRKWLKGDDPVKTHVMLQPECPYILDLIEQGIQSCEQLQRFESCNERTCFFNTMSEFQWAPVVHLFLQTCFFIILTLTSYRKFFGRNMRNASERTNNIASTYSYSSSSESLSNPGLQCKVCLINPMQITIQPCGHFAICQDCCFRLKQENNRCPICRGTIDNTVRTYVS